MKNVTTDNFEEIKKENKSIRFPLNFCIHLKDPKQKEKKKSRRMN